MKRVGDGRVTGFMAGNVNYRLCGTVFMAGNTDEIVDIESVHVLRSGLLSQPLMIEVVVGVVAADHRHQGLAR